MLAELDAGSPSSRRLPAQRATLRVGLSATAMVPLTSETMRRFAERHPGRGAGGLERRSEPAGAGLHEGTVDVAFVRPPFLDEGLSMVTVLTEERYAVLPSDHPLAAREYVRPEDVVGEPWIWVEGADPLARAFWSLEEHRGGRPLRTGTRVNSFEEAFGAVAAGLADHLPGRVRGAGRRRAASRSCASCGCAARRPPRSRSPGAPRTRPSWRASSCAPRSRSASARAIDNGGR